MATPVELPELDESAFRPLIDHLSKHNIQMNRYRKSVGDGKSQCYGMVRKRSLAPDLSRQSWVDPKLHHLLMKFALVNVPIPFTSIQVNDSLKCAAHKDKHNQGDSYIVGFGPYTGGELKLKDIGEYNIRHRPLLFNGSEIEHETKDFQGRRWTIVYHTLVPPAKFPMVRSLEDYEAVVKDDEWCIAWRRQGEPVVYLSKKNGLPHPLKGRKKTKELPPVPEHDPSLTRAQNLMIQARDILRDA